MSRPMAFLSAVASAAIMVGFVWLFCRLWPAANATAMWVGAFASAQYSRARNGRGTP
jgi:hypothetical protein